MHKKPSRDKKSGARNKHESASGANKTLQINDILSKQPLLARLVGALPAQQSWLEWLRAALPAELAAHIVNVVPKAGRGSGSRGELVIFADSAAWGMRLRYVMPGLEVQIRARDEAIEHWRVRIAPAGH